MTNTKMTLLIVDNDPSIRFSLCEIFRCMGHSVRAAEDGFYALQEMGAAIPDILLSDLNMPRMSGFELLSVVRRRFPSVYVIAMSGMNPGSGMPHGIAADAYYQKATGIVALLEKVQDGMCSNSVSLWASRKAAPIWVPPVEAGAPHASHVYLGCPECLRAFPQTPDASGLLQETHCAHCRSTIHYAVVEQFA